MTMTKDQLAEVLGVREALVRQWTRDKTIPERFYFRDGDRSYRYAPVCVALGELMLELGEVYGPNSPWPKQIAHEVASKLEYVWHANDGLPVTLTVLKGAIEVRMPVTCVQRARQKLATAAV